MKRMFRSLYAKLAIVLTALFGLAGLATVWVALYSTEMYQHEITQALNADLAEHIVQHNELIQNGKVNAAALEELFHMLMVINPSIEVYLLNPDGTIRAYSASPEKVKRTQVRLDPIEKWLSGNRRFPVLGDDPQNPDAEKVFSAATIGLNGALQGYLYVILGGESYDRAVQMLSQSYIRRVGIFLMLASLAFALVAGLLLFAVMTGRLKRLTRTIGAFQQGTSIPRVEFEARSRRAHGDEIDRLEETFLAMAQQIQEQMAQLQKSDSMRRELVANVSHDLRTPLAMLRGYIETVMLKEEVLSPEEKRTYLESAIQHCERLGSLVGDLFELAKLDSGDAKVSREPFNLAELVQDVVQEFQLKAEEKKIQINIDSDPDLPFVYADIGLIERVLVNLLDNAVRHTPGDGVIRLEMTFNDGDIAVQVSDTGSGIPEKDLGNVFERFYQSDASRTREPGRAGLGLAITRKILELHDRSIAVTSLLNSGTTFSFRLPASQAA